MAAKTENELRTRDRVSLASLILGIVVIVLGIALSDAGMGWVALLGVALAVNGYFFYRRR